GGERRGRAAAGRAGRRPAVGRRLGHPGRAADGPGPRELGAGRTRGPVRGLQPPAGGVVPVAARPAGGGAADAAAARSGAPPAAPGKTGDGAASGRVNVKEAPPPGRLAARTVPP